MTSQTPEETHNTREVEEAKEIMRQQVFKRPDSLEDANEIWVIAENAFDNVLHHQLQKAREEEVRLLMTTLQNRANTIPPNLLLNEIVNYAHDRIKVLNHPELNQDPVHDFFTAPEEVKRPVYERALAKTQEEQEKKLDQPTVKCGHHQAMLERAAVGLDQDGKCIDCGAEVLRIDTNK